MKVLVCIPCLLTGGTEIQTLSLVEALVEAGHQVNVACYFEHAPDMVARYQAAGAQVHLLSPDGSRPQGILPTIRHLHRSLRSLVRQLRPDAAHVQYMAPGAIPIIILRLLGIRRIIATAHTAADIYTPRGLKLLRWLNNHILTAFQCITLRAEQSFFGSASLLTPQTKFRPHGNHFTIHNSLPSTIVCCQPQAVPLPPQNPAHPGGLGNSALRPAVGKSLTVGVVSRLEQIKGMDLVIPAFAQALSLLPNNLSLPKPGSCVPPVSGGSPSLLIVGDGSQRPLMEAQARDLGIAHLVRFLGRQPQSELPGCYDQIDILLMPSRSEGFGLTAIEGMARGCVPLVADIGGLPEVVRDGTDGLLHRPEDIEDLAAKLRRLLTDPDLLQTLSHAAHRRAQDFTHQAYAAQIQLLYSRLP